jgi:hypothetical protein
MAKKALRGKVERIEVNEIHASRVHFHLLGTSPLICNRFQQKAWQELLLPSLSRNQAALEQSLKHDPFAEFRGSVYKNRDPKTKALVHMPNGAFHKAICHAALDIPGAKKAQIERLTKVVDVNIDLFGIPSIFCAMVRNSDISRTPDVRTRAIFQEWAVGVTVQYITAIITERSVVNLAGASGKIIGVGDWRSQKGGNFGAYDVVGADNADWNRIVKTQGRVAQQKAFATPIFYDEETEELLVWFEQEIQRREAMGKTEAGRKRNGSKPPKGVTIHRTRGKPGDEDYLGAQ